MLILFRKYILTFQNKSDEGNYTHLFLGVSFIVIKLISIFLSRHTNLIQVTIKHIIYICKDPYWL